MCNFALPVFALPEKARSAVTLPIPIPRDFAVCMAGPITGQRAAVLVKFDMLPPPGEAWRVEVESARRVVGEVLLRNGHMALDWRSTASMMTGNLRSCREELGICAVAKYVSLGGWC